MFKNKLISLKVEKSGFLVENKTDTEKIKITLSQKNPRNWFLFLENFAITGGFLIREVNNRKYDFGQINIIFIR